jgi:hypothetical protein
MVGPADACPVRGHPRCGVGESQKEIRALKRVHGVANVRRDVEHAALSQPPARAVDLDVGRSEQNLDQDRHGRLVLRHRLTGVEGESHDPETWSPEDALARDRVLPHVKLLDQLVAAVGDDDAALGNR